MTPVDIKPELDEGGFRESNQATLSHDPASWDMRQAPAADGPQALQMVCEARGQDDPDEVVLDRYLEESDSYRRLRNP